MRGKGKIAEAEQQQLLSSQTALGATEARKENVLISSIIAAANLCDTTRALLTHLFRSLSISLSFPGRSRGDPSRAMMKRSESVRNCLNFG